MGPFCLTGSIGDNRSEVWMPLENEGYLLKGAEITGRLDVKRGFAIRAF